MINCQRKIICFHLFNDYSGSPKVLHMVLERILKYDYKVELITSYNGILDDLSKYPNLKKYSYIYRFSNNPIVTMSRYAMIQLYTFFCLPILVQKECGVLYQYAITRRTGIGRTDNGKAGGISLP